MCPISRHGPKRCDRRHHKTPYPSRLTGRARKQRSQPLCYGRRPRLDELARAVRNDGLETETTRRGRFALRFATLEAEVWSEPRTIAESEKFFVNWADFPVLIESSGMLVAHWLQMNGGPGTSYDVHITHSKDGGATWSDSVVPHSDGTKTEHGFVSMVPELDGGFTAIWVDGRDFEAH